jgi:hypothetical protein
LIETNKLLLKVVQTYLDTSCILDFKLDDLIGDTMKFAKTFALTAIASSALMMGGCANNGYGYNSGLSNTAKGATAGAAAGALLKSGGNSKDIARGAIGGAAIGGAGAYILDQTR